MEVPLYSIFDTFCVESQLSSSALKFNTLRIMYIFISFTSPFKRLWHQLGTTETNFQTFSSRVT